MIENFDYAKFADELVKQTIDLVPKEFSKEEKDYIIKTIADYTLKSGEALYDDESLNFDSYQAKFHTEIIAEWTFHKSIDLINSEIPKEYWDAILQRIAFTIFEIAKTSIRQGIEENSMLKEIEYHVNKVYQETIDELTENNIVSQETGFKARYLSNIDVMAKESSKESAGKSAKKLIICKKDTKQINTMTLSKWNLAVAGCFYGISMQLSSSYFFGKNFNIISAIILGALFAISMYVFLKLTK